MAFWLVLVGMLLRGFAAASSGSSRPSCSRVPVPDQVRGRVFATEFAMFTLASAISAGAVGWGWTTSAPA
ncbi:MAG: hypothetical protein R2838_15435 [Caldilineaceae bacterium]